MSSSGLSRRALFGLGLSRLGERIDERVGAVGEAAAEAWAPAPAAAAGPTLEELAGRWSVARTPEGEALWARVGDALRALVSEVAREDDGEPVVSVFGPQSTPATRAAIDGLFASAALVAFSVWSTGTVAQLLKAAADLDPMPPGLAGVWGWGSRERLRQDLDHHADEIHYRSGEVGVVAASAEEAVERLAAAVPALAATLERHGDAARERFAPIAQFYVEPADDGAVRLAVPYLLVVARRR